MKDKKKLEKIVRNTLIVLTFISLVFSVMVWTNQLYSCSNDTERLNNFLVSGFSTVAIWIDNILIYILSIWYIVLGVKSKNERILKVSFSVFAILTTLIVSCGIINLIAEIFGIF